MLILISIFGTFLITTVSTKTSFFMMPFRIWEFLIGAHVAWYSLKNENKDKIFVPSIALIFLTIIFLFFPINTRSLSLFNGHPGIASLIITLTTAIILSTPFPSKILSNKNFITNLLIKIGDYSYSIYLVHFPIIVIFNYEPFQGTNLEIDNLFKVLLIIITTILITILMFNYIETTRYKKKFNNFFYLIIIASSILIISSKFISDWKYQNLKPVEIKIFNAYFDQDTFRCGTTFRLKNPTKKICSLNDIDSSKKVLFLGDSHGNSLKKIFLDSMTKHEIAAYFYASNYPLMQSRQNAKIIFKNIVKLNITNVIIHYNLNFYKTPKYYTQLDELLSYLESKEIRIDFISPVPTYDQHVPQMLYEKTFNLSKNFQTKSKRQYIKDNIPFFDYIKSKSIKYSRINLSHNFLCPDKKNCLIEIEGKPLYFDNNHLTLTGAKTLTPIFNLIAEEIKKK